MNPLTIVIPRKCTNCWSADLEWSVVHSSGMVPDGRLKLNECYPVFYLSCNVCSETLMAITEDDAMQIFNQAMK